MFYNLLKLKGQKGKERFGKLMFCPIKNKLRLNKRVQNQDKMLIYNILHVIIQKTQLFGVSLTVSYRLCVCLVFIIKESM